MNKKDREIFEAVEFAYKAHKSQMRRFARVPFIAHTLSTAKTLAEHGCSDDVVVASILHDTVEDTDVTLNEIKKKFGSKVAKIVGGVTELDFTHSWEERKKDKLHRLKTASVDVLLVTVADKIDNLRSMVNYARRGKNVWMHLHGERKRQEKYYRDLLRILSSKLKTKTGKILAKDLRLVIKAVFD